MTASVYRTLVTIATLGLTAMAQASPSSAPAARAAGTTSTKTAPWTAGAASGVATAAAHNRQLAVPHTRGMRDAGIRARGSLPDPASSHAAAIAGKSQAI